MIISTAVAIAEARMGKPGEKYYSGRSRAIMERAYITLSPVLLSQCYFFSLLVTG
jgi:hypothetical protein